MTDFIYAQPVKIWFGPGKLKELSDVLDELGVQKAVVVCGKHFRPQAEQLQQEEGRLELQTAPQQPEADADGHNGYGKGGDEFQGKAGDKGGLQYLQGSGRKIMA